MADGAGVGAAERDGDGGLPPDLERLLAAQRGEVQTQSSMLARWGWTLYSLLSVLVAITVVHHSFDSRGRFYDAVVFLFSSKISVAVLCNVALVVVVWCAQALTLVFLGKLYPHESERVGEMLKFAVFETGYALTVFRSELSFRVLALFGLILFLRFFHAALEARMDLLEQQSLDLWCGWVRFVGLQVSLLVVDVGLCMVFVMTLLEHGASVELLFAFECGVLALSLLLITLRFVLHQIDQRIEGQWLNKGTYLLFGSLLLNVLRLGLHVAYFAVVFYHYSAPLLMLRDLVNAFNAVMRNVINLRAAQQLRAKLQRRAWTIQQDDLEHIQDHMCSICRVDVTGDGDAVMLPCRHIYHVHCILPWFENSQTCPFCREAVAPDLPPYQPPWRRRGRRGDAEAREGRGEGREVRDPVATEARAGERSGRDASQTPTPTTTPTPPPPPPQSSSATTTTKTHSTTDSRPLSGARKWERLKATARGASSSSSSSTQEEDGEGGGGGGGGGESGRKRVGRIQEWDEEEDEVEEEVEEGGDGGDIEGLLKAKAALSRARSLREEAKAQSEYAMNLQRQMDELSRASSAPTQHSPFHHPTPPLSSTAPLYQALRHHPTPSPSQAPPTPPPSTHYPPTFASSPFTLFAAMGGGASGVSAAPPPSTTPTSHPPSAASAAPLDRLGGIGEAEGAVASEATGVRVAPSTSPFAFPPTFLPSTTSIPTTPPPFPSPPTAVGMPTSPYEMMALFHAQQAQAFHTQHMQYMAAVAAAAQHHMATQQQQQQSPHPTTSTSTPTPTPPPPVTPTKEKEKSDEGDGE